MTAWVIVRCVHGLEWVCADEIGRVLPQASSVVLSRREVTLELPKIDPALLALRTADDVFVDVGRVGGVGTTKNVPPELARSLAALPWTDRINEVQALRTVVPPDTPLVDVVASVEGRRNYNRFAVENAVGSLLAPLIGGSYLRRTAAGRGPGSPDLTIRIFVRGETALGALRVSALPLHRRMYKRDTGPGTLHPPVAAALAHLANPRDAESVLDPFCGDGTIAIETALTSGNARVIASDIDPARLRNAKRNASRAGVRIDLSCADAGLLAADHPVADAIVTNPPWNLSVDATGTLAGSLDPFWGRVPDLLSANGRIAVLTEAGLSVPVALRNLGFSLRLVTSIRLAGRVSQIVLAAPPGRPAPVLPDGIATWRERAIAESVVTRSAF